MHVSSSAQQCLHCLQVAATSCQDERRLLLGVLLPVNRRANRCLADLGRAAAVRAISLPLGQHLDHLRVAKVGGLRERVVPFGVGHERICLVLEQRLDASL